MLSVTISFSRIAAEKCTNCLISDYAKDSDFIRREQSQATTAKAAWQ
jgi:hypothetical protein